MSLIQPLNSAFTGIQRGLNGMQHSASQIASANQFNQTGTKELTNSLIESKSYQLQVEASAKMVKAIDETLGSLLDVRA